LNALSGPESGRGGKGYNVLFGGGTFSSYAQHPWEGRHAPGGHSDSGKYQFTLSTWHEAQRALGLKDFSPASQDKAAWWLAQRDYQRHTGRGLDGDLKSGRFDPRGLQNTWVSIKNLGAEKWTREYYKGATTTLASGAGGGGGATSSSDGATTSSTSPEHPGSRPSFSDILAKHMAQNQQGGGQQSGSQQGGGQKGKGGSIDIPNAALGMSILGASAAPVPENIFLARKQQVDEEKARKFADAKTLKES
jgi:muramidase (phage lysozyme)